MKMKMRAFLKFFLLPALFFVSCGDPAAPIDEEDPPEDEPTETVTITAGEIDQTLFAEADDEDDQGGDTSETGGSEEPQKVAKAEVAFTTTAPWTSTIEEPTRAPNSWIKLTPDSGSAAGDYDVVIEIQPNYSGADRSASVVILCGGARSVIKINQKAVTKTNEKPKLPDLAPGGATEDLGWGKTTEL